MNHQCSAVFFFFFDRDLLCIPGSFQTLNPPVSTSQILGFFPGFFAFEYLLGPSPGKLLNPSLWQDVHSHDWCALGSCHLYDVFLGSCSVTSSVLPGLLHVSLCVVS
jgi:hypothetical protein